MNEWTESGESAREALSADVAAALLSEIRREFYRINHLYFRNSLQLPVFLLSDAESRLGRYVRETRTLEISCAMALSEPWTTLVEVLKHEMAHQYVFEQLKVVDEPAHGPTFRDVCERMGIDGRAAGTPEPPKNEDSEENRALARIAKLLALAESSSVHEAQAAMNAAQRLMLKYNLERKSIPARPDQPAYSHRYLGRPSGRINEAERLISTILSDHFFVEAIWVPVFRPLEQKRGSVLEISGTIPNLEMASYVHSFLLNAGERLWKEHKKRHEIRGNRDRLTFQAGVMSGFYAKLNAERATQKEEGLIWIGDPELEQFYRRRHPRIQSVRYAGVERNDAHAHGRAAGQKLVLHRPVASGPSGGPKLLKA